MNRLHQPMLVAVVVLALTASADANAPVGRYTQAAGTVFDTKTKLTWQQNIAPGTYNLLNAKAYCAGLGATLGGAGWRLPTVKELQTLLDFSQPTGHFIDQSFFSGTPSATFWSSTPGQSPTGTPNAWYVDFGGGGAGLTVPGPGSLDVRCVR